MAQMQALLATGHASDVATVPSLMEAFERACKDLHDTGQPEIVREVIALRIIQIAASGERDPVRLSAAALVSLGVSRSD
jgi:hypothetical protein